MLLNLINTYTILASRAVARPNKRTIDLDEASEREREEEILLRHCRDPNARIVLIRSAELMEIDNKWSSMSLFQNYAAFIPSVAHKIVFIVHISLGRSPSIASVRPLLACPMLSNVMRWHKHEMDIRYAINNTQMKLCDTNVSIRLAHTHTFTSFWRH